MSQSEVIILVKRYLDTLNQAGIPIAMAYLYGSYARDEASQDSDIDLLLVSSLFDTNDDIILSKPWLYTTQVDSRIEPYSVGLKRFQTDQVSQLLEIIRREGIRI